MSRRPFRWRLRVRYNEVDAQALVYFARHLTYFDNGITEFLRALPFDLFGYARDTGFDFNVVRAEVDFARPVRLDDDLEVAIRVARLGSSSITFGAALHPAGHEEVLSQGRIVWVHADQGALRAVPLPDTLRRRLAPHRPPPAAA